MKVHDIFSYENEKFAGVRQPARDVIGAYQSANRFLDTVQEYILIIMGMPHFASVIHNLAHEMPKRFDDFADMLHERHLMAEYPATEELDIFAEVKDADAVFGLIIRILDHVGEALEAFRAKTDSADLRPMCLKAEELIAQNSADYTKILAMWSRFDNEGGSWTSFDAWCGELE